MPEKMEKSPFKIFVGSVAEGTTDDQIRQEFEKHGTVVEANVVKNYAFVHMENEEEGRKAIEAINNMVLNGKRIKCEPAVSKKIEDTNTVKLFVGNLSEQTKPTEVRALFEKYGRVAELDIIRNYGFVHLEPNCEISTVVRELHLKEVDGNAIKVQISTSRVRPKPGMGNSEQCYRCGRVGHWSKECPKLSGYDRMRFAPRDPYALHHHAAPVPVPVSVPVPYGRDRYDEYDYHYYDRYERPYEMFERHHDPMAEEYKLAYGRRDVPIPASPYRNITAPSPMYSRRSPGPTVWSPRYGGSSVGPSTSKRYAPY